jgi:predicted AAA+ superfamily ATPase
MNAIKSAITKTKKFVKDNSDDIMFATLFVASVSSSVIALRIIHDAKKTIGDWKLEVTDEIAEQIVVGGKIQTFVVLGETPSYAIVPPK